MVSRLLDFIQRTPTAFHAAANVRGILEKNGFVFVPETQADGLSAGDYCTGRNGSSLIAFRIPEGFDPAAVSFRVSAVHGDSPCFRLKPAPDLAGGRLNAEPYGGMILSSWLDRPLSLAGRVILRANGTLTSRLFASDGPVALIPNTAPHLREMNGLSYDPKTDLIPLFSGSEICTDRYLADRLGVDPEAVAGFDLSLVCADPGTVFGAHGEFVSAPRLDDLECVFACLNGFVNGAAPENVIPVFALFDNEETGSLSLAGAAGTVLADTLARVLPDPGLRRAALARSFFVSADNAHALHPNHPELSDGGNAPVLNGGPVIKYNAAQRYVSDGLSGAVFASLCREAHLPVQVFANRSDKRGGSTLGNLSEAQVPLRGVDIGAAQLAMHSARETAGCDDVGFLVQAMNAYYSARFVMNETGTERI